MGVSLPTVHRLVSDLADIHLVEEESPEADSSRLGRPPVLYRFREDAALLAGMDVGNETTRLAITTLSGRVLASQAVTSDRLGRDLAGTLVAKITEMVAAPGIPWASWPGPASGSRPPLTMPGSCARRRYTPSGTGCRCGTS